MKSRLTADDRRALVEKNLPLAYFLARAFRGKWLEYDDLKQVAAQAMWDVARTFDPEVIPTDNFGACAQIHINGRLRRAIAREARRRRVERMAAESMYPPEGPPRDADGVHEMREVVRSAIDLLPADQRKILSIRFGFDGRGGGTVLETAARARTSVAAVKRSLQAARRAIAWVMQMEGISAARWDAAHSGLRIKLG